MTASAPRTAHPRLSHYTVVGVWRLDAAPVAIAAILGVVTVRKPDGVSSWATVVEALDADGACAAAVDEMRGA